MVHFVKLHQISELKSWWCRINKIPDFAKMFHSQFCWGCLGDGTVCCCLGQELISRRVKRGGLCHGIFESLTWDGAHEKELFWLSFLPAETHEQVLSDWVLSLTLSGFAVPVPVCWVSIWRLVFWWVLLCGWRKGWTWGWARHGACGCCCVSEKTLEPELAEIPGFKCQLSHLPCPSWKMEVNHLFVRYLKSLYYEKHLAYSLCSINGSC